MNRTTLVVITLLSALATPVVVHATGLSKTEASVVAASTAARQAEEPACVRRIRVIYAGYGEAKATPCASVASEIVN